CKRKRYAITGGKYLPHHPLSNAFIRLKPYANFRCSLTADIQVGQFIRTEPESGVAKQSELINGEQIKCLKAMADVQAYQIGLLLSPFLTPCR
ncbi:TPA: hypothetical protein ACI7H9_003234, partial [Escherichia coli]